MEQATLVDQQDLSSKGSDLCVECGLCCNGFLHSYATLYSDEIGLADQLGLTRNPPEEGSDEHSFQLPCHCFQDGKCSVYPNRPRVCGEYKCDVLTRFLEQEVSFQESQSLVRKALHLVDEIKIHTRLAPPGKTIWEEVENFMKTQDDSEAFRRENAIFLLNVKKLERILRQFES